MVERRNMRYEGRSNDQDGKRWRAGNERGDEKLGTKGISKGRRLKVVANQHTLAHHCIRPVSILV